MYGCLEREKRTAPENHRQSFCKLALEFSFLFYEQREIKMTIKKQTPLVVSLAIRTSVTVHCWMAAMSWLPLSGSFDHGRRGEIPVGGEQSEWATCRDGIGLGLSVA